MPFRDRIRELRRVPARQLRPHPRNWRRHGALQRAALKAMLRDVGFANAVLARELPDGGLELIDGHLRAESSGDAEVPVLVLDVNAAEADRLLATLDAIAVLAETDRPRLAELVASLGTATEPLQRVWRELLPSELPSVAEAPQASDTAAAARGDGADRAAEVPESYQLLVDCRDESDQRSLFERLRADGYACRVLTL